jgi:hypothetical protein
VPEYIDVVKYLAERWSLIEERQEKEKTGEGKKPAHKVCRQEK